MHTLEESAPAPRQLATGDAYAVPREHGWFFASRFRPPFESQFLAHFRRAFKVRMRVLWSVATIAWLVSALLDTYVFPDAPAAFHVFRYVGLAIASLTVAVLWSSSIFEREALHALTTCAATGVALCGVAMFATVPYPQSFPIYLAVLGAAVISTIFVTTLSYELSAIGSAVFIAAFAVTVFLLPSVPFAVAASLAAGLLAVTAASLSCTNIIEQYARVNFAQRLTLESQSTALAEKAHELEVSEGKARDANLAKSVFLSNMSHELRTPLNAVLGFAQLLARDPSLSADGRASLKIIERSGDHLLALINDVLAISKIEAGRVTLTEHTFDLHEMIGSVTDMIRVRTEAKGLRLLVAVAPELPKAVTGDEGKLRQVLVNLLGNAVKFTDEGGIAVRAGWTGSAVLLELEDTGYGIAADEIGNLFEAFAQTESGRKSKEGTGLGLAISRNFIRMMGGDIRVQSELNRGTTFTVEVPLGVAEHVALDARPRQYARVAPSQAEVRLLVVDDTPENRLLLNALLASIGLASREAINGQEAVDIWRSWQPHLIWMDIRMPVLDGYEATRRIRELENGGAPCKIIALTASAFQHDRERILATGCDDFVTKPFRAATIYEKLTEHLGVEFLYDAPEPEEDVPAPDEADGELSRERLLALPADLLARLKTAMALGDIEAAHNTVEQIWERDEPLARDLQRLIRAYRFDDVLDAIE